MVFSGLSSLAFFALFAYLPCWIFAGLFRYVLRPLEIPDCYSRLAQRERRLMLAAYLTLFIIGIPILLLMYLIGLISHVRTHADAYESRHGDATPLIPQFSMNDMLAMVFSLGCTPALYQAFEIAKNPDAVLLIFFASLLTFPACFLAALYRLNIHDVPSGPVRMSVLALAPFIAIASVGIIPYAFFSIFGWHTAMATTVVFLLIFLAGRILARRAAEQGRAATVIQSME